MRLFLKGLSRSVLKRYRSQTSESTSKIFRHGLSFHWETTPPTHAQLKYAERFFAAAPPQLEDSATKFRTVKEMTVPEVAFLGRSNVGKSSLLNAILGKTICHTSKHPGRTRSMNLYSVGGADHKGHPKKLVVLDMPGYGKASRADWGEEIMKYLVKRKQLRRAYVLVDAMHGLKLTDEQMLFLLRSNGIPHQVILSKTDRVLFSRGRVSSQHLESAIPALETIVERLRKKIQPGPDEGPDALGELICTSADTQLNRRKLGIASLQWAVLSATGFGPRENGRNINLKDAPST